MKKPLIAVLILLFLPFSEIIGQAGLADSLNMAEREYFYRKYRSIRDTMSINTWLNLKRVSDNLEQVVRRDQQVIDALKLRITEDSTVIADLHDVETRYHELQIEFDDLKGRVKKDGEMILYLKVTSASLILVLLIFLVIIINRSGKLKRSRTELEQSISGLEESQHQLDALDVELRKLKQRETDFREELERGMESNQARLLSLQERCGLLESENLQLRRQSETDEGMHIPVADEILSGLETSDNPEELKRMVKSLFEERNSLINLAGKLRAQADAENRKNQDIINRINLLVNDLSNGYGK